MAAAEAGAWRAAGACGWANGEGMPDDGIDGGRIAAATGGGGAAATTGGGGAATGGGGAEGAGGNADGALIAESPICVCLDEGGGEASGDCCTCVGPSS